MGGSEMTVLSSNWQAGLKTPECYKNVQVTPKIKGHFLLYFALKKNF